MARGQIAFVVGLLTLSLVPLAQGQTASRALVALEDIPVAPVHTNDTVYVEIFRLDFRLENVICNGEVAFRVALQAMDMDANATSNQSTQFTFSNPTVEFKVPPGQYVTEARTDAADVTLQVRPTTIPLGGRIATVHLTATPAAPPTTPTGPQCVGNGGLQAPATEKTFTISFDKSTESDPLRSPEPKMPGPGVLVVLGLVFSLAFFRRRQSA